MKKSIFIGLVAVLGLIGCTRNQEIDIQENGLTLVARTESPAETKTVVEEGVHVYWEPRDEIAVFMGEKMAKFTTDITAASGTATYKGTFGDSEWPEEPDLWAVYPYSEEATFDGETMTTVLPSEQVAREGSFGKDMNLSIAHSTGTVLQFYNVGGGIRFSVTEEGIKKVMFEGLSGEIISGKVKIGFDGNGIPVVKEVSGGSPFITLLPPTGKETFEPGAWYYIVAIPGALESGYKLRFYKDSDYTKKVNEKAVQIKRSIFGNIEKADEGIEYEVKITHYPKSIEEWEDSFASTKRIIDTYTQFERKSDKISIDDAIPILEQIEGVLYVEPNPDSSAICVMQQDSTWITVSVFDPVLPLLSEDAGIMKSTTKGNRKSQKSPIYKIGGRALILSPFQWQFGYPVDEWYDELDEYFAVDSLLNSHASIEWFRGEKLDDYDFVLILSHGSTGKTTNEAHNTEFTTKICSGTRYQEGLAKELILSGFLDFEGQVAKFKPHGSENYFISALPSILDYANFNNTAVILGACETVQKTGLLKKRKMVEAFRDKGAAFVSGNDITMYNGATRQYVSALIKAFCHGFSFADAHKFASKSDLSQEWCNYMMIEYKQFNHTNELDQSYNMYKHTLCFPEDSSDDYYILSPVPILDIPENGSRVLKWTSFLRPFQVKWPFYIWDNDPASGEVFAWENPSYYNYSIYYNVYLNISNNYSYTARTDETTFLLDGLPSGDYQAYVISKAINEIGEEIVSYQSDIISFSLKEASIYDVPEAKDLGLSVKWASFNLGATKPEEYGQYFAWGETSPKESYDVPSYKWCNDVLMTSLTKYNTIASYGLVDNKTILESYDDAATRGLCGSWRTPTREEWLELVQECEWSWVTREEINGYEVTGKENTIFLPAAGYYSGTVYSGFIGNNTQWPLGYYWSSSLDVNVPCDAHIFTMSNYGTSYYMGSCFRTEGLPIRPVYDD